MGRGWGLNGPDCEVALVGPGDVWVACPDSGCRDLHRRSPGVGLAKEGLGSFGFLALVPVEASC